MNTLADPMLGRMIRGYRLERRLGTGQLTTFYHAHTEELWLPSELTIMLLHLPAALPSRARVQFTERFTLEASRLIKLRHPSLHPLFGYGEEAMHPYLLFPLPPSFTTLARSLHTHRKWSPAEAQAILAPLGSAFDYLHQQGLVYQFFTPSQVLLQPQGVPQIIGTGLLQLLLRQGLDDESDSHEPYRHLKNIAGDYISSLVYLAPEVIRGAAASTRSDIYSLGILLFELLSGQLPFTGETPLEIAQKCLREPLPSLHLLTPTVPVALELVVNRALHRNPDHRFATAGELLTAFSHILNERLRLSASSFLAESDSKKPDTSINLSDTPIYLSTIFTQSETDTATTEPFLYAQLLQARTQQARAFSTPDAIQKMAQHVQALREHIQGEYQK